MGGRELATSRQNDNDRVNWAQLFSCFGLPQLCV